MAEAIESAGSTSATLGTSLKSSEGEIEKAHVEDTENSENISLLLLNNPECVVSEMVVPEIQETEVETIPSSAVIQVSPSGEIAHDAPKMVVPEIQETLSSCAVKFGDDELDSMNVMKQEEKSEDDGIDSRSLKNHEETNDIIVSRDVKAHEEFADDAINSRTVKKQEIFESFGKCQLKIQVIDETALIDPPRLGNGKFNNGKRQETQGRKEKRSRRNGAQAAKNLESSGTHSQDCGNIGKEAKKRLVYSRKEMEALRFIGLEAQKNKWIEIYCGLGPLVAKEYDELTYHHKNGAPGFDFDPRLQFLKASLPAAYLDAVAARRKGNHLKVSVR